MSSVIQFLESLGHKPAMSAGEYTSSIAALGIDDAQRRALLERDHALLNELLNGREKVYCLVNAPYEDDQHESDDADGDGVPDRDEPEPSQN